ncbi:23S rRNA (guanosine(2251)-2'-O)-methyltransferase RlmB [Nocardiopsis gilva YIM 90087]|uniref:23S rRNA (Guanosine(2251)-2'-O)-methyltransferase RlmB n=1 Tax=Nocardiopsis gilva YIM 90087 TaxID=1235441 RepID=A0A223S251_9ACTN|nr:23S rRNA (guanosine(2251)-2'-O)-methyltransferase RlmB [Nocardiopsis gilva]ASU82194.1 23S rRNA (guanosine(2251)-2'-O)-methyltransferase RlmB [Nocardiopsis gilva YIM 90087]
MPAKKSKKGPTKGSGGKGRRSLEGKKTTLPAEERHWYQGKQRRAAKKTAAPSAARGQGGARTEPHGRTHRDSAASGDLLIGRNPVVEALRAGVPATKLVMLNSLDSDDRITEAARLAGDAGVEILEVTRAELDRRCESNGQPGAAHQGIALQVRPYRYWHHSDLLNAALDAEEPALIVALDSVTDPHNLGAIARSAAAFGAHGLLIPERRAAGVTMTAWKTSAGTLARLPVAQATNLTRALEEYKKAGLFVVGLDAGGDTRLDNLDLATGPIVVVVGSEGKGLSRLVRETCDAVASIPISGAESLNASVAAGVSLYEVARRRTSGE